MSEWFSIFSVWSPTLGPAAMTEWSIQTINKLLYIIGQVIISPVKKYVAGWFYKNEGEYFVIPHIYKVQGYL